MNHPPRVGRQELRILQVLWRNGPSTARQITEVLNTEALNAKALNVELPALRPVAHSTVQTLLRKLEAKNAVAHDSDGGRTFVFRAVHAESAIARSATRDLLNRLFDGSVSGLVAHLLRHETITPAEHDRLRQLIAQSESAEEKIP